MPSRPEVPTDARQPRRRTVGGMLTLAFTSVIALMAVLSLVRVVITEPLYRHTDAHRNQILATQSANSRVRALLDRAQLALDGYLATGNRAFLVPYEAAKREAPEAMADLTTRAAPD